MYQRRTSGKQDKDKKALIPSRKALRYKGFLVLTKNARNADIKTQKEKPTMREWLATDVEYEDISLFPLLDNAKRLCFTKNRILQTDEGDTIMAVVMKQYRTYKCIKCAQKAKTERVTEGYTFGNPFFNCPHCGALNYDPYIKEPALLSPKKILKDSKSGLNTLLFLLYMPCGLFAFFAITFALKNFLWGVLIVCPILALLTFLILRKKKNLDISKYKEVLDASMNRLNSSSAYAEAVIKLQGVDSDSLYQTSVQQLK